MADPDVDWLVLALAKRPDSHHEDSYRPIVLFSMIYRLWASLRCRQLLALLEHWVHSDAHGFLPGREALASWATIQSAIEYALQTGQALHGLATDLKKAFNNIQRPQWFLLAAKLGLPDRILRPWKTFLGSFSRRFQVHGNLSSEIGSNVGFAEGDPLSVMAMVLIDWSLHIYQHAFAPPVRTLSFVDNISLLSRDQGHLILGFFALKTFLDLWGLELDLAKSYAWSTKASDRKTLALLGLQICSDAAELGGSLSLGASKRVRLMLARGSKLAMKWHRLKISKAPLAYKLASLPIAFWSAALHGSLGCVFSDAHIHGLRKQAMKALNIRCGGMNSLLRLSLVDPSTADPGFYQLRTCIFDFRRLADKCPDVLQLWSFYMLNFDGTATSGPFYKMLDLFGQIGWRVSTVPWFYDHDDCCHNLMELTSDSLEALLLDAWFQRIASQVHHRQTMHDLRGVDVDLAFFDRKSLSPPDLGRLMALQAGAFLTQEQKAKFDLTKQPDCPLCGVPADLVHWFHCPELAPLRTDHTSMLRWFRDLPSCTLHHLLVPRAAEFGQMKRYLLGLIDQTEVFLSVPGVGPQHLFSDGSFFMKTPRIASTAAWSLVNASTGSIVGAAPVPGLHQSSARGELFGVLAALKWCLRFGVPTFLWCDAATVVKGVRALQRGAWQRIGVATENADIWRQIQQLLDQTSEDQFNICWIPSHLDSVLCDPGLEEWISVWNDVADRCAVDANLHRGEEHRVLSDTLQTRRESFLGRLRHLRDFYFTVAKHTNAASEVVDLTQEEQDPVDQPMILDALTDDFVINWQEQLRGASEAFRYPVQFVMNIFEAVCHLEIEPSIRFPVSFIELSIWLLTDASLSLPVWDHEARSWRLRDYHSLLLRPTLANVVAQIRQTITQGLRILGLETFLQRHLNRSEAGIVMPVDGLLICTCSSFKFRIIELCKSFAGARMLRKASDLAKPIT